MLQKLRHIIIWLLLLYANTAGAQVSMPDTVCKGTTRTYSVNDPTVPSTYTWKLDGVTLASTTNSVTLTWNTPGTFVLTVQEMNALGCLGDIRSGTVYVFPLNTLTLDRAICANQLPYSWFGHVFTAAGTVIDTVPGINSCDTIRTLNLAVNPLNTQIHDSTICASQLPFTWLGHVFTAAGIVIDTIPSSLGCDTARTITLRVNPQPVFIIHDPPGVCAPATVDLTLPAVTSGSDPGLGLNYWTDANATVPLANPAAVSVTGTYYIKATNSFGCSETRAVRVAVNTPPTVVLSGTNSICWGDSTKLSVHMTGTAPYTLVINNGIRDTVIGPVNTATYEFMVHPASNTTYVINSITDAYCASTGNLSSVTITVYPPLLSVRYPTITTSANYNTQLSARNLSGATGYTWSPNVGLNAYNIQSPVFYYDRSTEYLVRIVNAENCFVTDTLLVNVIPPGANIPEDIFVPKGWTPNGDGHNDLLRPLTQNIREIRYFRVYNRWGQLVYETHATGQGWDGYFSGKQQPSDTYTWVAQGIGFSGRIITRSGNSVLLR